jgi:hypothetical protein
MSTSREQFFLCTLTTRSRRVSRPVLAWDEVEAELLFREDLADEGLSTRGRIHVETLLGPATPSTGLEAAAVH